MVNKYMKQFAEERKALAEQGIQKPVPAPGNYTQTPMDKMRHEILNTILRDRADGAEDRLQKVCELYGVNK
jgi:hypothetical protein